MIGNSLRHSAFEQIRIPSLRESSVSSMTKPISRGDSLPVWRHTGHRGLSSWKWRFLILLSSNHNRGTAGRQDLSNRRGNRSDAGRMAREIADSRCRQSADHHRCRSLDHNPRTAGDTRGQCTRPGCTGDGGCRLTADQDRWVSGNDIEGQCGMRNGCGHRRRRMYRSMTVRSILQNHVTNSRSSRHDRILSV